MDNEREVIDNSVIVTDSWYNLNKELDRIRYQTSKNSVERAINAGYSVFIVDGGSPNEVIDTYQDFGATVLNQEKRGMGNGRRQVIEAGYNFGKEYMIWMEIEKESFVSQIYKTLLPIVNGEADIIVPERASMESYPREQQLSERIARFFFEDLTGEDLDCFIGPRVFRRDQAHYFTDYKTKYCQDEEYGDNWEVIFMPLLKAIHEGKKVKGVKIDYTHPATQTQFEEGNIELFGKRIKQLSDITQAMTKYHNELNKH